MDFTIQTNNAYAPYAGVTICSLLENNTSARNITVHLFGENLSKENADKFKILAKKYSREIKIYDIDYGSVIPGLSMLKEWNGSYSVYVKLFAPLLLDIKSDKVVHLDADMIINTSLEELFNIDMKGKPFAAVSGAMSQYHKKQIGLTRQDRYVNLGLIVFNIPVYKKMNCAQKIIENLSKNTDNYSFLEQDAANILFHNDIVRLDVKYNFPSMLLIYKPLEVLDMYDLTDDEYYSPAEIEKAKQNPAVYHLLDCFYMRPWIKGNKHPKRELFRAYLLKTPWKDYPEIKAKRNLTRPVQAALYKVLPWSIYKKIHIFLKNKNLKKGKSRY